jgi:protein subunit release factor A
MRVRLPSEVPCNKENRLMESVIVEVRAAEGGEDAKLLVKEQLGAYVRAATLHRL